MKSDPVCQYANRLWLDIHNPNESWAFEQNDFLDIFCGAQIEKQFSLDDLSLYTDEIASGEVAEDITMEFDNASEAFDILYTETAMSREEYKEIYGDDYTNLYCKIFIHMI